MAQDSSILAEKNVGVIGFNARPIAASLKRQGAQTYVSDYWGDLDLPQVSTDCIAVLSPTPGVRQRQPLDLPLHESLIDNFRIITKEIELDYVIVGSGFDDRPDLLNQIYKSGVLTGTHPDTIKQARNYRYVTELISGQKINTLEISYYDSFTDLVKGTKRRKFPYLIRPTHSGGGSGIRYIGNQDDLRRILDAKQNESDEQSFVIQEYIRGHDYSCSVLSTGEKAKSVSVQAQLIGSPAAGRNCDFAYCGNFYPSGLDTTTVQTIEKFSETLSICLGLKGSVGFDFVIDEQNGIHLIEINPRIQGTLEMLEIAGNISITEEHVKATNQNLIEKIPKFKPTVKMIAYSRRTGAVPDLTTISDTYDLTPMGVLVNRTDPICTVIKTGEDIMECYHLTCDTVHQVQRLIAPLA